MVCVYPSTARNNTGPSTLYESGPAHKSQLSYGTWTTGREAKRADCSLSVFFDVSLHVFINRRNAVERAGLKDQLHPEREARGRGERGRGIPKGKQEASGVNLFLTCKYTHTTHKQIKKQSSFFFFA